MDDVGTLETSYSGNASGIRKIRPAEQNSESETNPTTSPRKSQKKQPSPKLDSIKSLKFAVFQVHTKCLHSNYVCNLKYLYYHSAW